jgi:acetyl-CoA carboxylase carboxyltransferase component
MKQVISNISTSDFQFMNKVQTYSQVMSAHYSRYGSKTNREKDSTNIRDRLCGRLVVGRSIEWLIVEKNPFLKLSHLSAYRQYNYHFPWEGIITGFVRIHGKLCMIIVNETTGGIYIRETEKKHFSGLEIAMRKHLPCVYLVNRSGIFLPELSLLLTDYDRFGRIFYNQSRTSSANIPQASVAMGSCITGGASIFSMSYQIMTVKNPVTIFTGGPHLVKAATGEEVTTKVLKGTFVHTIILEVVVHLAENEIIPFQIYRNILNCISHYEKRPIRGVTEEEPAYNLYELGGPAPIDFSRQADNYEIIAGFVDGGKFEAFKQN